MEITMEIVSRNTNTCQQWAVVYRNGKYRTATADAATRGRNLYGDEIIASDLTGSAAQEWCDSWNSSQPPDLDDLLIFDQTEPQEFRGGLIQEFDIISVRCLDGIFRTGAVLDWNESEVEIEVGASLHIGKKDDAELICKAEDWSLYEIEFAEWLDHLFSDETEPMETPDTGTGEALAATLQTVAHSIAKVFGFDGSEAA